MSNYLDFAAIKAENPIASVVDKLGLELKKSGASLRGKCPTCESTSDRNLAVTPEKNAYFCFTDGKGGDQIGLVSHITGLPAKEAAQFLAGDVPKEKKPTQPKGKPEASEARGFKELDYLEPDHEAVTAIGLDPEDARRIGAGYAKRGVMRGTVAWPVRLSDGTLIGYIGLTEAVLPGSWRF